MTTTPLTDQQLDDIAAKAAELRERLDRKNPWPSDNESHWTAEGWKSGTRNALDKLHVEGLVAEVRRLRAQVTELEPGAAFLAALEAGGVDSWEGYDDARAAVETDGPSA